MALADFRSSSDFSREKRRSLSMSTIISDANYAIF